MNYGATKTQFKALLNRRDCTDTLADIFLQNAISRIQRTLRVPSMEKSIAVTLTAGTYFTNGYLPIPADYIEIRDITVNGKSTVDRAELSAVLPEAACETGTPTKYARQGAGWVFAPQPLSQYTDSLGVVHSTVIRVDYYAEFDTETAPTDDTILTQTAFDLVIYGALAYACDYFTDKRGDKFEARYVQIGNDIQEQADEDELAGGAVVAPAYEYPEDFY